MKRLVLTLWVVILAASAWAEGQVYTLEQCIQMAQDKDPDLIRFRNAVKTANAAVWQQAGNFLPSAGLYYSQTETNLGPESERLRKVTITEYTGEIVGDTVILTPRFRDTLVSSGNANDVRYKSYGAGISLQMTLFNGFSRVWNYLGSRASKRGAEYNYSAALSDLIYLVKTDYYLVLKAKKDLEVAHDATNRSQELLNLFEEKYELGSASLSEVLKQRVQYGNDQLTAVRAEYTLANTMDNLALDIGLDPQADFDIADIDWQREDIGAVEDYIRKALERHPSLMARQSEVEAYKYEVRSAWGQYLPSITLSYDYGWGKSFFSDLIEFGPFDHSSNLRLSANFTIFDGFSREYNMTRAKVGLNNSRASEFHERNAIIKDVESAHLGIKLSEEVLRVTEEVERSASEDMDLVQEKYNLGAAALWELLDAQVSLKEAQFNTVKAAFDYNLAKAQLQNAIGE